MHEAALRGMPLYHGTRAGMESEIVDDEDDPEMDAYVVCYCPSCAQREFGRSKPRHNEQGR